MKTCSKDCIPLCDFCRFYDFNGDEEGAYTGDGFCNLKQEAREPYEECQAFECHKTVLKVVE